MNTIKRKKAWAGCSMVLGMALILTAWLATDLSAGTKGNAFGKSATTEKSGVSQLPGEPVKVLIPGEPVKKIQQSIKINPGGPVELNPQPLPPKAFQQGIKINPGGPVGLNPQPLPPR
jgi:hypothetical protein